MLHCSFFVCLLVVLIVPHAARGARDYEARESVAKLEATVDILTNEVMRLRDTVSELKCNRQTTRTDQREEEIDKEEGPDQIEEEVDNEEEEKKQLRLGEIRREEIPSGYRVAVQFWSNLEDKQILADWISYDNNTISGLKGTVLNNISETDPTLKEVFVDLNTPSPSLYLQLYTSEHGYGIALNGAFQGPEVYRDFKRPYFDIRPQRELVYEKGKNASFTVVVEKDREKSLQFVGTFVDLTTEKLFDTNYEFFRMFNTKITKTFFNTTEVTVTIDTAKKSISGFVFVHDEKTINNNLIEYITLSNTLILRPSQQRGPLPEGYLSFYNDVTEYSASEANPLLCNREKNTDCEAICMLFGEKITNFTVTRTNPEGQMTVIPAKDILSEGHWMYEEMIKFRQTPDATGTGTYVFECTAYNAFGKQVTERRVARLVYKPAQIVLDETRLRFLNNSTVQVTCAVTGDPASTIQFIFETQRHHNPSRGVTNPDSVQHLDLMDIATKTLELNEEEELSVTQCLFYQDIPQALARVHTY